MKIKLISNKTIYLFLFLIAVIIFPQSTFSALLITKTFSESYDWEAWTKSNVQEDYSGGLRLMNNDNAFQPDGYATYQFSPGGINNKWRSVSILSGNTSTTPNGSSTLQVLFSPDNSTWYDEGNLDNGLIPDSASLYIKATFHSDTMESKILRSLNLTYLTKEEPRVLILKRVFKKDSDANPIGPEISTFEPGNTVIVRIKIDPMGLSDLNLHVQDYRPSAFNITPITTTVGCGLKATDNILSPSFGAGDGKNYSSWSGVNPQSRDSYICYQYTCDNTVSAKNDLIQSKLLAYFQSSFDSNLSNNQPIASFSGYQMVKGFAFSNSEDYTDGDASKLDSARVFPIDDFLSFARTNVSYTAADNTTVNLATSGSYFYKRGLGQRSRGGELYSLPVKMEDGDSQVIATDQSYILYNPAFYLFGNLFSGSSLPSKLDYSSRSNSISRQSFPSDRTSKLNSEASLYGYNFDKNSVLFWDTNNAMRNKSLEESINSLTGPNPPEIVCAGVNQSALTSGEVFLDNPNCNINSNSLSQDRIYPSGRVWLIKASGNVEVDSKFYRQGTIIIDFQGNSGTVNINTQSGSFQDGKLGLMVINGGKVNFAQNAQEFKGLIFVPSGDSCAISFEENGKAIKIKGSLVSDTICFAPREKTSAGITSQYAVAIYSDQNILNSALPGFENLMSVIIGN